jgi:hypothetical protein
MLKLKNWQAILGPCMRTMTIWSVYRNRMGYWLLCIGSFVIDVWCKAVDNVGRKWEYRTYSVVKQHTQT